MPTKKPTTRSAKPRRTKIENASAPVVNGLSEAIMGFTPGGIGTQINQVDTLFVNERWYLVSNMRQVLSQAYVEHGLIQGIVDIPVNDALRGGIDIKSKQLSQENIESLQQWIDEEQILDRVIGQAEKWNRLFGGAGILTITDENYTTELKPENVRQGGPLEFRALDMWEMFWSKQNTQDYAGAMSRADDFDFYDYYGFKVHKSRIFRLKGIEAPSFVRPRLRGWGVSVVETLVYSINQYLKSNNLTFEVLDEFKLDIFKIKNLTQTLLSADGDSKIRKRVQLANQQKNFQHALTMDAEDDYVQKQLSFGGIAEMMREFRMQIASDMRMPMSKIFGIGSTGFSSGEDDIENYNAMVEGSVRGKLKKPIIQMLKVKCQQEFGIVPTDLNIAYKPLRILGAEQEQNVKTAIFNRLLAARSAGHMTEKEFKDACNKENLLVVQLDTSIDQLEMPKAVSAEGEVAEPAAPKSVTEAPIAKNALEETEDLLRFKGPKVVSVGVISGGELLTGKRRDNGLWTCPGGHIDAGETLEAAACREVLEESGIRLEPSQLKFISAEKINSHRTGKDFVVFSFLANVQKEVASISNDPDKEISQWKWVPISKDTPELKPESRHAKKDIIVNYLLGEQISNANVIKGRIAKAQVIFGKEYYTLDSGFIWDDRPGTWKVGDTVVITKNLLGPVTVKRG